MTLNMFCLIAFMLSAAIVLIRATLERSWDRIKWFGIVFIILIVTIGFVRLADYGIDLRSTLGTFLECVGTVVACILGIILIFGILMATFGSLKSIRKNIEINPTRAQ
jgi:hypothetical protein